MCGIAGIVSNAHLARPAETLRLLSEQQSHRGPDDWGFLLWDRVAAPRLGRDPEALGGGSVGLVHRRLSIVDLSPTGWQPMADETGRYAMVYNGEIYNYPALRAELEAAGYRFRSTSDSEVLFQLLIREGTGCFNRLTGMFAVAFLDCREGRLLLARDQFGIKPLHYAYSDTQFSFASEIRPLLAIGAASRQVNTAALFRYLRHAVTNQDGATLFCDIHELPPAHYMEVDLAHPGRVVPQPYWQPGRRKRGGLSMAAAAEELRGLFLDSVRLHMTADVPVAATLSGGIDSSGIVCAMQRIGGSSDPLPLFSYYAGAGSIDESHWIGQVASSIGGMVHPVRLQPGDLAQELDGLILSQEQPFGTSSMWAQAHVFAAVHQAGYKVVLDGQGADELFAGYPVFRAARLEALIRHGRWSEALGLLTALPQDRRNLLLMALAPMLPAALQVPMRRLVGRSLMPDWLNGDWFGAVNPPEAKQWPGATPLQRQLLDATFGSSLPMLLRYADRNAMRVSVENRVPFLTTALADFATGLSDDLLIAPDGTTKAVLRQALRGLVPDAILDRRDKIGFVTPEADWFGRDAALAAYIRDTAAMPLPGCFTPVVRNRLLALADGRTQHDASLWRCLNLLRWAKLFGAEFGDIETGRAAA
ncbi:MAG: asparagine synthase (glutamine-hydrolyzing) [Ferrovibrio sp.]|nr:asparagine synthase (glutamine-hydrolyzing) [Ferrovibrio sp.]